MKNLHYYVTGNTAGGFVNHIESNLHGIKHVIALEHPSVRLKTAVIKKLAEQYEDNHLEILESSLANHYLDGIIIRDQSIAFLDDRIATERTDTVNLTERFQARDKDKTEIARLMQKAYDSFAEGLRIHDDLEDIYINEMDFDRANAFAAQFIHDLLRDTPKKKRTPLTYTRLFGTNTADGVVNVVPHITQTVKNVYYIKGRAGTGKSTFMKRIADACETHGFDVELYYCSFDPGSVDMVLVRDLDFCIFDSTDPHEFFPSREGERIVDLYEELVAEGTDEKYEKEINDLNTHYKSYMKEGIRCLKAAGRKREELEDGYMTNVTANEVENVVRDIHSDLV